MSSCKYLVLVLVAGNALAAGDGFLIGAGVESDSDDGLRGSFLAGLGLGEKTWLSAGLSRSSVELPIDREINASYADLELDHWFKPVGIRIGLSYWGDSDILDSNDWRASLYYRGDKVMLSADYEFRDFDFTIPATEFFPEREITFDADGLGAQLRIELTDAASVSISGKKYDYSVDFRPLDNTDALTLISVSRLSLINSLIDSRANIEIAIDSGLNRWEFDFATWEGEIDKARTKSVTIRYLRPIGGKTDVEFGLGYDDSELYGDLTFFSVFLYFYGGS